MQRAKKQTEKKCFLALNEVLKVTLGLSWNSLSPDFKEYIFLVVDSHQTAFIFLQKGPVFGCLICKTPLKIDNPMVNYYLMTCHGIWEWGMAK